MESAGSGRGERCFQQTYPQESWIKKPHTVRVFSAPRRIRPDLRGNPMSKPLADGDFHDPPTGTERARRGRRTVPDIERGVGVIKDQVRTLPNAPGVYRMLDEHGDVAYKEFPEQTEIEDDYLLICEGHCEVVRTRVYTQKDDTGSEFNVHTITIRKHR